MNDFKDNQIMQLKGIAENHREPRDCHSRGN